MGKPIRRRYPSERWSGFSRTGNGRILPKRKPGARGLVLTFPQVRVYVDPQVQTITTGFSSPPGVLTGILTDSAIEVKREEGLPIIAGPGRRFVVHAPCNSTSRFERAIRIAMSDVASGNRLALKSVLGGIFHDASSPASALNMGMSMLGMSLQQDGIPGFVRNGEAAADRIFEGIQNLQALRAENFRSLDWTLDHIVARALAEIRLIESGCTAAEMTLTAMHRDPRFAEKATELEGTVAGIRAVIDPAAEEVQDPGVLQVLEPISLRRVVGLEKFSQRVRISKSELLDVDIMGNKYHLDEVFRLLISNTERALGLASSLSTAEIEEDAAWIDLSINREAGYLEISLSNEVIDDRMAAYLRDNWQNTLRLKRGDPLDDHTKQAIFLRRETSRALEDRSEGKGGIGLSRAWAFVHSMHGTLHAEYNRRRNVFTMICRLPLVESPA